MWTMEKESNNSEKSEKLPFKITEVTSFDELDWIRMTGDCEDVEMGQCLKLQKNMNITTYSYGAGPCISGILQTNDNDIYMFHSTGESLTEEQLKTLENTKKGIIGGGETSTEIYRKNFESSNVKIIPHPDNNKKCIFDIVYVKEENEFSIKPGLYYCYEEFEF